MLLFLNPFSSLRYGHIMIMSDQDHDGSHIKGLLINLIHNFWPELIRQPGFLSEFITPIVKGSPLSSHFDLSSSDFHSDQGQRHEVFLLSARV